MSSDPVSGNRILIVEDAPANIQSLSAMLREKGYQISVATNGRQALQVLGRVKPDLVLMDVMMPEMDGYEACRQMKESPEWKEIPVIFLTARSDSEDLVRGFDLGAVDYVAKPFNAHELLARVNTHLTVDHLRRSLAAKNVELARAHELVRHAFGRYVSEEVAESLLKSPEALDLGGEEREVTILMSDLRGFTAQAARLTPHEVIAFLNLYLEAMVEVIGQFKGTIDEIIGDAILVLFGAPVASEDHASRAVACGLAMQLAMTDINHRLAARGAAELEMGIGIHTGRVVVGNIGSKRRTKYAAVGSNVNLAGRIESFTTGGQILISDSTRNSIRSELRIAGVCEVEPKGAPGRLRLFEVTGMGDPFNLSLPSQDWVVREIPRPLTVRFTVLEEKFAGGDFHEGRIVAVGIREVILEAPTPLPPLRNLKIEVADNDSGAPPGEFYGKVMAAAEDRAGGSKIRLTSMGPALKSWVHAVAAN